MLLTGAVETLIGLGRLQPIPGGWRLEATPDALDSILSSSLVGGYQWQIDNLGAVDRAVLEAAAAVGARFTAAAVAQALDSESVDVIDGRLAALADRRVLVDLALQHSRQPVPAGPLYRFRHPIAARLLLARTSDSLPRLADRLDAWVTFARRA
jgi:hypothetical protein